MLLFSLNHFLFSSKLLTLLNVSSIILSSTIPCKALAISSVPVITAGIPAALTWSRSNGDPEMWYFEESNMQWDASRSGPIFSAPHQAESEGELPVTFFETGVFQLIAFNVRDAFIGQWQPFTTFNGITVIEAQTATTLNASPLPATVTTFLTLVTTQSIFSTITNNHENMQNSQPDTSKIAAGVAGGIVAFLLFTCISVFLLCRRRRRSRDHYFACIRERKASTHLSLIGNKGTSLNGHLRKAQELAKSGMESPVYHSALPSITLVPLPDKDIQEGLCKITVDAPEPHKTTDFQHISPNHRIRSKVTRGKDRNLAEFRAASKSSKAFWDIFRKFAGSKALHTDDVDASDLLRVFDPRMNPPSALPDSFNQSLYELNEQILASMPERTNDLTPEKFFDRLFVVLDVEKAKDELGRIHPGKSSAGEDEVHYADIRKMDSVLITDLVNDCLENKDNPVIWIISILIGILKKGKDPSDANGYRAIALESCMLKFITLLFLGRIMQWAESRSIIPPSQNGFRKNYRTNNNAFILRSAIEKAKSMKKTLWVASVDISNAFPSVHRATLWLKLRRLGAGGRIFDWLRMIYRKMKYKVRHGESTSDEFQSLMGILTGDTLSPILWILYFSDFNIPETSDDIKLSGIPISHLEQADDLLLIALSPEGLQRKMNLFYNWCRDNAMVINALKSVIAFHGNPPPQMPNFHLEDSAVSIVPEYTYVGMTFRSGNYKAGCAHSIFESHFDTKAAKATSVAHAVLHIESMIGHLPVDEGRILYMGCIDPHLIYGCEVALDTSSALVQMLESVQERFFRRLLGLTSKAATVILFTETGIVPIQLRRMELALRFFLYALQRPPTSYIHAALMESIQLYSDGYHSWFSSLLKILGKSLKLTSVEVHPVSMLQEVEAVSEFHAAVKKSIDSWVESEIQRTICKVYLIPLRKEPNTNDPGSRYRTRCMRQYLSDIRNSKHRKSLTKLIAGDLPLAVERLRWTDNHRRQVPRNERVCRFCVDTSPAIEDAEHALLHCTHPPLVELRNEFLELYFSQVPRAHSLDRQSHTLHFIGSLISCKPMFTATAKYVYQVMQIFESHPLYVPPAYRR